MGTDKFAENLREKGSYETSTDKNFRNVIDRLLGRFDSWYYTKVFLSIYVGYLKACFGKFGDWAWMDRAWHILNDAEKCGGKISVEDAYKLKEVDGPVVLVANHMSMLETMLLPGALIMPFKPIATVVKTSLLHYPVFGKIMGYVKNINVDRKNPREDFKKVMTQGVEFLENGRSVIIFPQATRSAELIPAEFNSMGIKLAEKAGVPIMPVALKTDFQGVGSSGISKDFGRIDREKSIHFKFGDPVKIEKNGKEVHRNILRFIGENLKSWGGSVREDEV